MYIPKVLIVSTDNPSCSFEFIAGHVNSTSSRNNTFGIYKTSKVKVDNLPTKLVPLGVENIDYKDGLVIGKVLHAVSGCEIYIDLPSYNRLVADLVTGDSHTDFFLKWKYTSETVPGIERVVSGNYKPESYSEGARYKPMSVVKTKSNTFFYAGKVKLPDGTSKHLQFRLDWHNNGYTLGNYELRATKAKGLAVTDVKIVDKVDRVEYVETFKQLLEGKVTAKVTTLNSTEDYVAHMSLPARASLLGKDRDALALINVNHVVYLVEAFNKKQAAKEILMPTNYTVEGPDLAITACYEDKQYKINQVHSMCPQNIRNTPITCVGAVIRGRKAMEFTSNTPTATKAVFSIDSHVNQLNLRYVVTNGPDNCALVIMPAEINRLPAVSYVDEDGNEFRLPTFNPKLEEIRND